MIYFDDLGRFSCFSFSTWTFRRECAEGILVSTWDNSARVFFLILSHQTWWWLSYNRDSWFNQEQYIWEPTWTNSTCLLWNQLKWCQTRSVTSLLGGTSQLAIGFHKPGLWKVPYINGGNLYWNWFITLLPTIYHMGLPVIVKITTWNMGLPVIVEITQLN